MLTKKINFTMSTWISQKKSTKIKLSKDLDKEK
jgi:hypothetical protein